MPHSVRFSDKRVRIRGGGGEKDLPAHTHLPTNTKIPPPCKNLSNSCTLPQWSLASMEVPSGLGETSPIERALSRTRQRGLSPLSLSQPQLQIRHGDKSPQAFNVERAQMFGTEIRAWQRCVWPQSTSLFSAVWEREGFLFTRESRATTRDGLLV